MCQIFSGNALSPNNEPEQNVSVLFNNLVNLSLHSVELNKEVVGLEGWGNSSIGTFSSLINVSA
jgi:hypothetical protein